MQENCVFCKIISGEIPAHFVHQGERIVAFLDINPLNKGHVLLVPRDHAENVFDIEKGLLSELIIKAQEISWRLREKLGAEAVNLFNASGSAAEQSVFHFHLHLVPRWPADGLAINDWWREKVKKFSSEELEELAAKLKF